MGEWNGHRTYLHSTSSKQQQPQRRQPKIRTTPISFNLSTLSKYPGTCLVDQVGVNAPGRPINNTFLFLRRLETSIGCGGKLKCNVRSEGNSSPTWIVFVAASTVVVADANNSNTTDNNDDKIIFIFNVFYKGSLSSYATQKAII
jgi:hypothetical protein